ncbi:LVIVD repeat-containing protein [Hymenobacter sp. CRA2]|uniref:LVIVD repeat-containing protein n=1 Tax=Hymenobacter sp. CRA2 TaxID=1955620 RepID=UPI00098EDC6D|nr:hypothetical protein [Hymenobacter sp. CRA2]OON69795.1 hypothetical protein B0919_07670 [Hymenobacter sp. CRA2]
MALPFALFRRGCAALLLALLLGACSSADVSPRMTDSGRAGSMSRFAILGNMLYAVDNQNLRVFDLTPTASTNGPQLINTTSLGVGIETIYPESGYLFIGTQAGMYIYDTANPRAPRQLGYYQHAVSCDPVVVDGRYAYITLRSGRPCGGGGNQLQVVDLQDLSQPRLAQSYPLQQPYGLGVDSARLFVCDNGLKVFDKTQTPQLTQRDYFQIEAYDVIPYQGSVFVIGSAGLYQYRYLNHTLSLLSVLPVTPR